jgi:rhamnose transport system permease protein
VEEEGVARAAFPLEGQADRPGPRARQRAWRLPAFLGQREAALVLAIAAVALTTQLQSPDFLSPSSLAGIAANGAALALASIGETLVIASGAIDISVGSILALSAAAAAFWTGSWGGVAASLGLAALLGLGLGSINAAITFAGRLHPIITTLGTLGIFRGAFLLWTGGEWLELPSSELRLAVEGPLGIPASVWGVGIAAAAAHLFLGWTRPGRACLAAGDNPGAARAHGFRVDLVRFLAFAALGTLVGLAGVFQTARFGRVQSSTGAGFELQAIAAAVLGGAHVGGGRGSIPGALLGAALIEVLADARAVWGIHERWQLVTVGVLMLGTLAFESALARLGRSTS